DDGGRIETVERAFGGGAVERDAAREPIREAADRKVRVRHGRLRPASSVAGRPGVGARALRADPKRAATVAPDDRAAARSHRVDVDARQMNGKAADRALARSFRRAACYEAYVRRRSAHVETDRVLEARKRGDFRRTHRAGRGARDE